jgi:hypothetical protein
MKDMNTNGTTMENSTIKEINVLAYKYLEGLTTGDLGKYESINTKVVISIVESIIVNAESNYAYHEKIEDIKRKSAVSVIINQLNNL